jgi:hypothetical protein
MMIAQSYISHEHSSNNYQALVLRCVKFPAISPPSTNHR